MNIKRLWLVSWYGQSKTEKVLHLLYNLAITITMVIIPIVMAQLWLHGGNMLINILMSILALCAIVLGVASFMYSINYYKEHYDDSTSKIAS